jgi:hypothetical protein
MIMTCNLLSLDLLNKRKELFYKYLILTKWPHTPHLCRVLSSLIYEEISDMLDRVRAEDILYSKGRLEHRLGMISQQFLAAGE